jgi:outer membrane protein assembly factor BamA
VPQAPLEQTPLDPAPTENANESVPIRAVRIVGARVVSASDLEKAALQTLQSPSESLNNPTQAQTIRTVAEKIRAYYRERGYTLARVVGAEVDAQGTLTLTVMEGRIRTVRVKGNSRTRTKTVQGAIALGAGDVYNEKKAAQDRTRLARLGIFADVSVAPQVGPDEEPKGKSKPAPSTGSAVPAPVPGPTNPTTDPATPVQSAPVAPPPTATETPDPNVPAPPPPAPTDPLPEAEPIAPVQDEVGEVDLVVRIQERSTGNVAATVGYADGAGAVGFVDLSEGNLFGTAHRASLQWQRTTQSRFREDGTVENGDSRSAFEFGYEVPSLRPGSLAFGADVYNKNTVFLPFFAGGQETIRTYERRRGVRARVGTLLGGTGGGNTTGLFFTTRRDEVGYDPIPDRVNNVPISDVQNSRGTIGAFGVQLLADGRDVADNPRRGYRHTFSFEQSARGLFGGNRPFRQFTLDLRQYAPLLIGRANPDPKKPVPVLAARVLTGVITGDVPLSEQYFLGGFDLLRGYDLFSIRGERMILGTVEGRVPLSPGLQGVVFSDAGNAWRSGQRLGARDLRASVGLGLRFLSPIGPIRLDAAYGSRFQTYVSLGQSF